jgi:transcriptional regulator with GAF, ATPase, and Fis domain
MTVPGKLPALTLAALKRRRIEECLADNDGNLTQAARELDVSVRTLQRTIKVWAANDATSHYKPSPKNRV